MATYTITQTTTSRKSFSGKAVDRAYRRALANAVMAGSNEKAFRVLSSVGPIDRIPGGGENFIPLNGIASFYDVAEDYLRHVLGNNRLIEKRFPEDIRRVTAFGMCARMDIPLREGPTCDVPGRADLRRYCLTEPFGMPCVSFPKERSFLIYSPRVTLAIALLLPEGKSATIKEAVMAARNSGYEAESDPILPEPRRYYRPKTAGLTQSGDLVVSPETLLYIIQTAAKDAVTEFMRQNPDLFPDGSPDD